MKDSNSTYYLSEPMGFQADGRKCLAVAVSLSPDSCLVKVVVDGVQGIKRLSLSENQWHTLALGLLEGSCLTGLS